MNQHFPNLLKPLNIGGITIKNRFCMAPMMMKHLIDDKSAFNDAGIRYFTERAKGGFGLIFLGAFFADTEIDPPMVANPLHNQGEYKRTAATLLDRAHAYGAKVFSQVSMGPGRNILGYYTPSELPSYFMPTVKSPVLSTEQIKRKIELVIQGAKLIKEAGFDGLEVHAMHEGYLLDEFAMSLTNHRTDEYGGSFENGMRAAKEIIEGIKQECGSAFPVSMRLCLKSYMKGFNQASLTGEDEVGRTLEESVKISKELELYGYDVLNVDAGVYDSLYYVAPPMYMEKGFILELTEAVKKAVKIPVLTGGGRLNDPYLCEKAILDGKMDAVVYARQSLADPYFPQKVQMGVPEKIRPCIGCNQGCRGAAMLGRDVSCAVNPVATRELNYGIEKALTPKKIAVIGGGVAGMELARTAKLRGHEVSVYEKSDKLGGHLISGGHHSFKSEVRELNDWYQNELKELKVPIYMNKPMDAQSVKNLNADAVVLAVGSEPVMPKIPGIDHPKTISSVEALLGKKNIGQKVVVVGGGLVGCELALDLAQSGKQVTIIEALDEILSAGEPVPVMNSTMLRELLQHNNVTLVTGHRIEAVDDQGAVVKSKDGTTETLAADTVVIAIGFKPVKSMAEELYGSGVELYSVGDGRHVGNIMRAVWESYEVARSI